MLKKGYTKIQSLIKSNFLILSVFGLNFRQVPVTASTQKPLIERLKAFNMMPVGIVVTNNYLQHFLDQPKTLLLNTHTKGLNDHSGWLGGTAVESQNAILDMKKSTSKGLAM